MEVAKRWRAGKARASGRASRKRSSSWRRAMLGRATGRRAWGTETAKERTTRARRGQLARVGSGPGSLRTARRA